MKIKQKILQYLAKGLSLQDYSSFDRAFADYRLLTSGKDLVGWIASATNVWGTYFTKAKFRVYENTSNGLIEIPDHPFSKVMRTPNDYQVWWEIQYQLAVWWVLYGKAFWLKLRNSQGKTVQIVQLKPWLVDVVSSSSNYIAGYKYRAQDTIIKYKPEDIIYLKIPATDSFIEGRPVISGFMAQQEVDEFQTAYQQKFYKEGGFAGRTFVAKAELGQNTFERILENLKEQYSGEENAFKVALLELIEPVKAAYSMKEMDIANQRMLTRDEILGGMQVPKIILGVGDDIGKGNAETAVWQFASGIVDPFMSYVDSVLSVHLRNDYGNDNLEVIHDVITPKDAEQSITIQKEKFGIGALTLNEVRKLDGMPLYTFPLADKPLINLGGNIVNLEDEEIIGVAADPPDDKPDSNPNASEPKKSAKEIERVWKQFARRHGVLARTQNVEWKQFFNEQQERLISALEIKGVGEDMNMFYFSEEEMVLLNDFLHRQALKNTQSGFEMGNNITNNNSFYNPQNIFVRRVVDGLNQQAMGIQKTTLDSIQRFIGRDINNLSNSELSRVIKLQYGDIDSKRVPRIVNTTITAGLNAGLLHSFQEAGFSKKRWLTEGDGRVRNRPEVSHTEANKQEVSLDAPFIVAGEELMFPADPMASAKNAVNCRCTIIGIK